MEERVCGRRRDVDHRFWLREPMMVARALADPAGDLLGYVYFWPDFIGPLVARTPPLQLLRAAAEAQVAAGSAGVRLHVHVPGPSLTVLKALLERGFRIDHVNLFMSSRPFGRFDRYLPAGGVLL